MSWVRSKVGSKLRLSPMRITKMKITKRQLKRIIKEEKAKLLKESVVDMVDFELDIEEVAQGLAFQFGDAMHDLLKEDPEMFVGRSTPEEWAQQVEAAQMAMTASIITAINGAMEAVETELHDGQFKGSHRR